MFMLISNIGEILQIQSNDLPRNNSTFTIPAPTPIVNGSTHYFDGEAFIPRPVKPVIPTIGIAPLFIDLTTLSAMFSVVVENENGDSITVTDVGDPLILVDPGQYTLSVVQTFPHISFKQEIFVD